jgi:hypothetical protein
MSACDIADNVTALNTKFLFDDFAGDLSLARKRGERFAESWETLRLMQQQTALMVQQNAAVVSHAINTALVLQGQTGNTEGQQTISPIRTGTADTLAASSYPANRSIDTSDATVSVASANLAGQIAEFTNLLNQFVASLQPVLNAASGTSAGTSSNPATNTTNTTSK